MDNKRKKILQGVAGLVVALVAYFAYHYFMYVETDNAQIEASTVMLASKVPGYIIKKNVVDGQKVKKDEVLIEIDNRDYKASVQSAESELLSLEARKKDAEKNYNRLKQLHLENAVSAQQYDSSLAGYNEIKAKYDSANAKLTQAKLNLEYSQIKAPSDGIVAKTSAEIGQLASSGQPLVGFVSSESRWVTANFKETEIKDIKIGRKVDISVDAFPGLDLQGEVENIFPATGATFTLLPPDNSTGNFTKVVQRVPVRIKFVNANQDVFEKVQAGLSVIVKVHKH